MSNIDYAHPQCEDISGAGYGLRAPGSGDVEFGYDPTGIVPIALFDGAVNSYLYRVDGGAGNWADITGGEVFIIAAQRGLSLGGWFWWSAVPGGQQYLMAKDDTGANRQYGLVLLVTNQVRFFVFAGPVLVTSTGTINAGWNHCAGIYDQTSQDLSVVLNGVVTTNAGAAPAALADTAASFTIGADGAGGNRMTGYASDCFLGAVSLSHGFVKAGYHYTKAAYGVK
jgi:hypothetical protein